MAHFYGTVQGGRTGGPSTVESRTATKDSKLRVSAQSYEGVVRVAMWRRRVDACDMVMIWVTNHAGNGGKVLYSGPVRDLADAPDERTMLEIVARPLIDKTLLGET